MASCSMTSVEDSVVLRATILNLACGCRITTDNVALLFQTDGRYVGFSCASALAVGSTRRPKRYFPFAEGPRNCVGQNLAKVSLVATAATLLSSLSFRLADEVQVLYCQAGWFFQPDIGICKE